MKDQLIYYDQIPIYAKQLRQNECAKVVLSRYQAFLFRKKTQMMRHVKQKSLLGNFFDIIKFLGVSLAIFITCPKVMFLSDLHEASDVGRDRIEFQEYKGKILVIFNENKVDSNPNRTTA